MITFNLDFLLHAVIRAPRLFTSVMALRTLACTRFRLARFS